jgi:hypothetical protein
MLSGGNFLKAEVYVTIRPDRAFGYIEELPERIRPVFQELCQDVVSLKCKWQFYLDVFAEKENVELLNDVAPASFRMIEESFISDIIMSICRLADPTESCGRSNLSFKALVADFPEDHELNRLLDDFASKCKPIVDHRHKRFAHNDRNYRL